MKPTRDDGNAYVNFVLYAVLGRMAEADALMRKFHDGIKRTAAMFTSRCPPIPQGPLYRGMLVDPAVPLVPDPRLTFLSWSEDRDVACWFASRESVISEPLAESNPKLRGVVLELAQPPQHVLFHHSWGKGWAQLARMHPHMGEEGARQIEWSLRTQREVITMPLDRLPPAISVEDARSCSVADLDKRLAPPWFKDAA